MVECEPVGDAPAAIVPGDGEALETERVCQLDDVGG
jgi:hypothetical protein